MKLCEIFWLVKSEASKIYQPPSEANYMAIGKTPFAQ